MPGEQRKHSRGNKTTAPAPPPAKVADTVVPAPKATTKGMAAEAIQKTVDAFKEPRAPSVMIYTDEKGQERVADHIMKELAGKTAEAIKRQVPQPAKQQAPDPVKQHREPAKQHREHPIQPGPKVKLTKLKQAKLAKMAKLKEIAKEPGKQQHHQ